MDHIARESRFEWTVQHFTRSGATTRSPNPLVKVIEPKPSARRLWPVSYTHLTLPTICSV
eukprot:10205015-Alexandrium_andersonii.AAC.1